MAHMIWKGAISFGLVHVPVQLYPGDPIRKSQLQPDRQTLDRSVGYKQINKRTGKEVTRDNIVRGFEYEKGKYVVMSDAEIRSANPESTQTVDSSRSSKRPTSRFCISTRVLSRARPQGRKSLRAAARRIEGNGQGRIANVVLHNKQHLAALIRWDRCWRLNTLRWAAEVRSYDELKLARRKREKERRHRARTRHGEETDRRHERYVGSGLPITTRFTTNSCRWSSARSARARPRKSATSKSRRKRAASAEILDLSEVAETQLGARQRKTASHAPATTKTPMRLPPPRRAKSKTTARRTTSGAPARKRRAA